MKKHSGSSKEDISPDVPVIGTLTMHQPITAYISLRTRNTCHSHVIRQTLLPWPYTNEGEQYQKYTIKSEDGAETHANETKIIVCDFLTKCREVMADRGRAWNELDEGCDRMITADGPRYLIAFSD